MGTGREARQVAPARIDELEPVDGLGKIGDRTDAQLHRMDLPEFPEIDKSFCMLRAGSNPSAEEANHGFAFPPGCHRPRQRRARHRQDRRDREEPRLVAARRQLLRRLDDPRFPVDNTGEEDEGLRQTGTTLDNGTVFRVLELAPGSSPRNHRTDSIDYAVVMSGEIDMELDDTTV